ncbi:hypothetical protein KUCAC02_000944 [Chaenocephalus aceratus]|uniref:Uncharacterized protein n=2 Tax=Chaenocephalus aceratus TaxID=36190 RepID=A0ACB9XW99_CHAAC|nr:hypothetical protein KUCAC02_000944 [Chaenocephalus aceratus]KAI4831402.1 hypothetical protein KUCAC02_000944 [Chaenocephalus aceratus]
MSAWVTKEVMRWGCFCSRRSLWQQSNLMGKKSPKYTSFPSQQLAHIWGTKHHQTCLESNRVSSVRFYSKGTIHREVLEEKEPLSSPLTKSSLPDENQSEETAPKKTQWTSSLMDRLQSCGSPSDVLELTSERALTFKQISSCLCHIWFSTKKMSTDNQRYELQLMFEHPGFDVLLQQAMTSVGRMSNGDVAYSLLSMVNIGVPQDSRVIQTFLRNCQENLNDMDERSLSILASCLRNLEPSNNADALKDGLRMVVEARLPEIKNVKALQNMMRMLGKDAPMGLKRKFEEKALSMSNRFSLLDSHHIITAMAAMKFHSKPLLDICCKIIRENINGIPFNQLFETMQSCRQLQYRDSELLTDLSEHAASMIDIWTKKQVVLFLSVCERLAFCPAAVMEAFAGKVIENPKVLTLKDLLCVVKVYSTLNYDLQHRKQQFLDSLIPALVSYLPKMSSFELLKVVYHLCLLGHFPSALLEPLLQSSTLEKFKSTDPKYLVNQERMFQTVNLCLHLEHPVLPQPLTVPPTVLGAPVLESGAVIPELSQCLQSMMEDRANTTLQERVLLLGFYFIDGVITKPLPSGTDSGGAESRPRIAVLFPAPSSFCFGTSHPRGTLALKMRHLKTLGYDPVWVTERELQSTPEEKRTDFLRGRIFPEHRSQAEVEKLNTNQEARTVHSS